MYIFCFIFRKSTNPSVKKNILYLTQKAFKFEVMCVRLVYSPTFVNGPALTNLLNSATFLSRVSLNRILVCFVMVCLIYISCIVLLSIMLLIVSYAYTNCSHNIVFYNIVYGIECFNCNKTMRLFTYLLTLGIVV